MNNTKLASYPLFSAKTGWFAVLRYTLIIVFFALVATAYFIPATLQGRELYRADVEAVSGNGSDTGAYNKTHPEDPAYWTNSLFGGMPTYQISPSYPSTKGMEILEGAYTLRWPLKILGSYPWLLFALMTGFFIFLKSLKIRDLPAIFGAIMWGFSSYFVILISAGHLWKLATLAYIPPTIAGMILIFRKKYLLGATLLAFFTALQLLSNHVQMTYYFLFVMAALFIAWMVETIRAKEYKHFLQASSVLLLAGALGIAINSTNLFHTYSYSKETMRGGTELTLNPQSNEGTTSSVNAKGLEKEYITQWSYGIGETWSLLVPNIRGGASEPLAEHPRHLEKASPQMRQNVAQMSSYWGNQPFTSGPVYVGIFVVMLFLLGALVVKGPVKWALLITTLLSIFLSWGKNFMPLTDFFIDYFPLYNKFRAVSSILVIAQFTIPTLAILGLVKVIKCPDVIKKRPYIPIVSFAVPIGILLLMLFFPSFFGNFLSRFEAETFTNLAVGNPAYNDLMDALERARRSMFSSDVIRSLIIAGISLGILFLFLYGKIKTTALVVSLGVVTLGDLWGVCKRYLHDDMFQRTATEQVHFPSQADLEILKDTEPTYRVLNLSVDPFNDASTSRWHRSIGGYHAAKLQRYQDLIDYQLRRLNPEVLNMLNTRYFIIQDPQSKELVVQSNPEAFGSAWFPIEVKMVENANEEMNALSEFSLRKVAIVDKRFATEELRRLLPLQDPSARLKLKLFTPKELQYEVNLNQDALAVFSQIYYPHGWKAEIIGENGNELPIIRTNYVLRGIVLPSGNYTLRMYFDPTSIHTTEAIAKTAFAILLLLTIATITVSIFRRRNPKSTSQIITEQQDLNS